MFMSIFSSLVANVFPIGIYFFWCVVRTVTLYSSLHFFSYLSLALQWFNLLQTGRILTVRDLLSWVSFINVSSSSLPAETAMVHGAFLILLDGLSLGILAYLSTRIFYC